MGGAREAGARGAGARPRVLLVDNHDSYTYNLYHLIGRVCGSAPVVVRNDEIGSVAEVRRRFSHVVISPGPGHPADPRRIGRCPELIADGSLPVLGVCLGHQAIALAFGGRVGPVEPRHGRISEIHHDGTGLLRGVPPRFRAVRYHSLAVTAVGEDVAVVARAEDGVVMALRHTRLPLHGVQFHPESVRAEHGERILGTFLAGEAGSPRRVVRARTPSPAPRPVPVPLPEPAAALVVREAPWRDPEDVFAAHYAGRRYACWLDSAAPAGGLSRWSYLGAPEGPRAHVVSHHAAAGDVFELLRERLARLPVAPDPRFSFAGGYLGYFGYEAGLGGAGGEQAPDREPAAAPEAARAYQAPEAARVYQAPEAARVYQAPEAAFAYVERFLAFDHQRRRAYAVAVAAPGERAAATAWAERMVHSVRETAPAPPPARDGRRSAVRPGMELPAYTAAYRAVQDHLRRGDSYEVNLTFRLRFGCTADHAELYRHLRRANPAPFAAFLRLPGVCVLSSSPERFLRIDPDGRIEARPIKGTTRRHPDPAADAAARRWLAGDEKTFTENLMVTDLLRNDLGQVCQIGTVEVPRLMAVESYATVHQLVTTVRGVREPAIDPVSCVRAILPGGSMTGAPKRRTTEIIDEVENDPRGVYSGALGYLSLSGHIDLSMVIRTIVARGASMSIGVGGGVVAMSDPVEEYHEAHLKAAALLAAVDLACGEGVPPGGGPPAELVAQAR